MKRGIDAGASWRKPGAWIGLALLAAGLLGGG